MILIVIIGALAAERGIGHLPGWGSPRLLRHYVAALRSALPLAGLWQGAACVPVVLLLPVLATYWIDSLLTQPLLHLMFSAVVLFFCLGPRDLADDVALWLEAREAGDRVKAERLARSLQQGPERYGDAESPDSRGLLGALFIQSHERLFGVLLWFLAAGIGGAVLYRLASRLPRVLMEHEDTPAVDVSETFHAVLAWLPARLTAVLFGLAGSLDDALKDWRALGERPSHGWRGHTWAVLAEVSSGSIEFESPEGGTEVPATLELAAIEVLNLQMRALMILLAFVAVFATGDWLG